MLTAGSDHVARLWRWPSGKVIQSFNGHSDVVFSARFSPDGRQIVTSSFDTTARIFETHTGRCIHELRGHRFSVFCASFSPDGTQVITGSADGSAKVWDMASGAMLLDLSGHCGRIFFAFFTPDGSKIVTSCADGPTLVWSNQGRSIFHFPDGGEWPGGLALSTDGNSLYLVRKLGDSYEGEWAIRTWDLNSGQVLKSTPPMQTFPRSFSVRPDGARLLFAGGANECYACDGFRIEEIYSSPVGSIFTVTYSPDGSFAALQYERKHVAILSSSYEVQAVLTGNNMFRTTFSPDGKRLLLANLDGSISVYRNYRPAYWWGLAWLPEFWLTLALSVAFCWSLIRDFRTRGAG